MNYRIKCKNYSKCNNIEERKSNHKEGAISCFPCKKEALKERSIKYRNKHKTTKLGLSTAK